MTIYYFDVKNGSTERDHAGAEFESDSQAIARARTIADEMGSQPKKGDHARHISVIRDDGREVVQVKVEGDVAPDSASRFKKFSQ
jgi:hypothetical protein